MKTIEVLMHIQEEFELYKEPKYSIFVTGETEELGRWTHAIRMDDLRENYCGTEVVEFGMKDRRIGFRFQGTNEIIGKQYKLLFGKTSYGGRVPVEKLIYEKNNRARIVNGEPDNGYHRNDRQMQVLNGEPVSLSVSSFVDLRPLTAEEVRARQSGKRKFSDPPSIPHYSPFRTMSAIDYGDSIFEANETIYASIDVGYGNTVYISGKHILFSDGKECFRMENKDSDSWSIILPPGISKDVAFQFYIGKWELGRIVATTSLKKELEGNKTHPAIPSYKLQARIPK